RSRSRCFSSSSRLQNSRIKLVTLIVLVLQQVEHSVELRVETHKQLNDTNVVSEIELIHRPIVRDGGRRDKTLSRTRPRAPPARPLAAPLRPSRPRAAPRTRASSRRGQRPAAPTRARGTPRSASRTRRRSRRTRGRP